jgi:hypothetical protein
MNKVRRVIAGPGSPAADRKRRVWAFAVAAVSDLASLGDWMFPPIQIAVDIATALVLWMLLGWRWPILPALIAEAIPGLGLFPTWTLVAGAYLVYPAATGSRRYQHEQDQLHGIEQGVGENGHQQAARAEIGHPQEQGENKDPGLERPRLVDHREGQ